MQTYELEPEIQIENARVRELVELLWPALLLPWPKATKGTRQSWGHLTLQDMKNPRHIEKLGRGNIGVALGGVSNGLCAIDIDRDELVQPFHDANPLLADTLQTYGARGRVYWVRLAGDCPKKFDLKTADGKSGEFRSHGHQSIISGIHPDTGRLYQFIVKRPPMVMEFSSIKWPSEIERPCASFSSVIANTNSSHHNHIRSPSFSTITTLPTFTSFTMSSTCTTSSTSHVESDLSEAEKKTVLESIPSEKHQSHERIFRLARAVRALEKQNGCEMSQKRLNAIFDLWYKESTTFLRPEESRDDYFFEFLAAMESVKYPLGESIFETSWQAAQVARPPPEAAIVKSAKLQLLMSFCRELQRNVGDRPFFLATRTVQRLFVLDHPMKAWRWLNGLCSLKILKLVKRGKKREEGFAGAPNEFRYIGDKSNTAAL